MKVALPEINGDEVYDVLGVAAFTYQLLHFFERKLFDGGIEVHIHPDGDVTYHIFDSEKWFAAVAVRDAKRRLLT